MEGISSNKLKDENNENKEETLNAAQSVPPQKRKGVHLDICCSSFF